MTPPGHQKVTASHLQRDAYLYVRQSTVRQVFENTESTQRQYALRERAVALGWAIEQVVVIDSDLGQSGASSTDRAGFQRLVGEVGMGRAGIVLGLEVSRLARNSSDWHRLLEICAVTDTLLLDEDGVYSPSDFNDRLLLGLKGTMSARPVDEHDLIAVGEIGEDEGVAADPRLVVFDDRRHIEGRDRCVDGVPASLQGLPGRVGLQRMLGGDHRLRAHDDRTPDRPVGRHLRLHRSEEQQDEGGRRCEPARSCRHDQPPYV